VLLADPAVADLADHLARGGGEGLTRAHDLGPGATIQEVILSGLRGRGGGGFPTGRKWQSVRDGAGGGRTFVVANGAEGEPATFKDRAVIRANPYAVVEGVAIAAFAVGAERAFIGIKERFEPECRRLAAAVDEMTAAGRTGDVPIQVVLGPDAYLFGEETGLLQVIEGGAPRPARWRPSSPPPIRRWSTTSRRWRWRPRSWPGARSGTARWAPPGRRAWWWPRWWAT
jgi:NADH-quinone oxidoreductase subunit F